MCAADDVTARARQELELLGKIVDALEPLDQPERFRVLAAVAARFGHYQMAHAALNAAERAEMDAAAAAAENS